MPIPEFVAAVSACNEGSIRTKDSAAPPPIGNGATVTAATSKSNSNTGRGDANQRDERLAALQPAERKAYFAYVAAESQAGGGLEDREAFDRLKLHGLPDEAGLGELTDYVLPAFDTWSRQLRAARNALGEQKYSRRAGRPAGGSIAKASDLERHF